MSQETGERQEEFAALIGIDWADQEHHVCMRVVGSNTVTSRKLLQKPEDIAEWIAGLRSQFPGRQIAVAIEQSRGAAVIETHALAAAMIVGQLRSLHKFLLKYDQQIAQTFRSHDDAGIFSSFPGAAEAMAPRLLAAFGSDREYFGSAAEMQKFSGVAPVTERSGQSQWVHRRWSAPKFVLQTFHKYANISIRYSIWAKALYEHLRAKGKGHHSAIRAVAFKWIRVMFRCWQDRVPYDEIAYIKTLQKRGSYLFGRIADAQQTTPMQGATIG